MNIKIIKGEKYYEIHSVSHTPVNFTPFTSPNSWQDFYYSMRFGYMDDLYNFEIDKEYTIREKDLIECKRIKAVNHDGLIYDDVFYKPIRVCKLEKILK